MGVVALGFIFISPAYAVPISPDKYYLDVSYGMELDNMLLIMGREELAGAITLYLTPVGMKKYGEEHEREFYIADPENPAEPANWVTLSATSIEIGSGQEVRVPWTMTPSKYVGCGTNLAAIMVSDTPTVDSAEDGIVTVRREIISQIHLNVLATDQGACLDNKVDLNLREFFVDKKIPVFNYDDIPFVTRIENEGNLISRSPQGFIDILGFGDKITVPFNEEKLDIYPQTVRKFDNMWTDSEYPDNGNFGDKLLYEISHLRIGRYEARFGVTKNADPAIVSSAYFWVIPWRVLLVVGGVIVVFVTYKLAKRKKSRRKEKDADVERH